MVIKLPKNEPENLPLPQKLRMLDLPGAVVMILALISLSLSLQRIASTGTSSDYRTWIWFSTFVVCAGGFIAWQIRIKDELVAIFKFKLFQSLIHPQVLQFLPELSRREPYA